MTGMFSRCATCSKRFDCYQRIRLIHLLSMTRPGFIGLSRMVGVPGILGIAMILGLSGILNLSAIPARAHGIDGYIDGTVPYTIHLSENGVEALRPEPGYFDEMVLSLFTKSGLSHIVAKQVPWKRVMEEALKGSRHVIYPTTRTIDRENSFKWVGPVSRTIWNLYGYADAKWQNMAFDDILKGARIGVLMGSAREPYLRERGAKYLVMVPREDLLLPMLQADRVDLIAIGGSVLRHYRNIVDPTVQHRDIDGILPYRSCFLYLAISNDAALDDIIKLQITLDKYKQSGQFMKNRGKHGLSTNQNSSFLRAMLNLENNGVGCVDMFGRDD